MHLMLIGAISSHWHDTDRIWLGTTALAIQSRIDCPQGWKTGYIIAMIVLGFFCLVAFFFWEKYFATVAYLPFRFLKDRTIIGACFLYGIMFLSIL